MKSANVLKTTATAAGIAIGLPILAGCGPIQAKDKGGEVVQANSGFGTTEQILGRAGATALHGTPEVSDYKDFAGNRDHILDYTGGDVDPKVIKGMINFFEKRAATNPKTEITTYVSGRKAPVKTKISESLRDVEHEIVFVNDSSEIPESITKSSTSNAVSIEAGTRFYSDQTISFITIHDGKKPENYGNAATELYGATTDLKDLSPNPSDIRKRLDIETMANRFGDAFMFAAAGKTYTVYDRKEGELGFATITVNDSVSDYDYSIKPDSVDLPMYHLIQHTLIDVKS